MEGLRPVDTEGGGELELQGSSGLSDWAPALAVEFENVGNHPPNNLPDGGSEKDTPSDTVKHLESCFHQDDSTRCRDGEGSDAFEVPNVVESVSEHPEMVDGGSGGEHPASDTVSDVDNQSALKWWMEDVPRTLPAT